MVRHHRIASAIVLTLALAAAAPAAAMPQPTPSAATVGASTPQSTNLCSEVCSARGYVTERTGAALPHDPRARSVALAGAGYGYGVSPIASGGAPAPRSEVVSGAGYGHPNAPVTVVRVTAPGNGFHWGDAGIGAGGAVILMVLVLGGVLGATSLRRRATGITAQPTS